MITEVAAYPDEAVRRQLRRAALDEWLAGMQAERGPVPDDVMEEVRRQWPVRDGERCRPS